MSYKVRGVRIFREKGKQTRILVVGQEEGKRTVSKVVVPVGEKLSSHIAAEEAKKNT